MPDVILRKSLSCGYTKLPTSTLDDPRISYRALGVLAYLLSRPDGWRVTHKGLMRAADRPGREGRDAVLDALGELEAAGFYCRHRVRDSRGRFHTETWISDTALTPTEWADVTFSQVAPTPGLPTPGGPELGEPGLLVRTEVTSTKEVKELEPTRKSEHPCSPTPTWPAQKREDDLSPGIDADRSHAEGVLAGLREERNRVNAAYTGLRDRALAHIASRLPEHARQGFVTDAIGRMAGPGDVVSAFLVAVDATTPPFKGTPGAIATAWNRLRDNQIAAPSATPEREGMFQVRDRLNALHREVEVASRAVEERESLEARATRLSAALADVRAAGGPQGWLTTPERVARAQAHLPGGEIPYLAGLRDQVTSWRGALGTLGLDAEHAEAGALIDAIDARIAEARHALTLTNVLTRNDTEVESADSRSVVPAETG